MTVNIKELNNGSPRSNPYGKVTAIAPSFENVDYYDCYVPYTLTCGQMGGYVIRQIPTSDVGSWGPMPDAVKSMRVANYVNIENEGESSPIQEAINIGKLKRYVDPETDCYIIESGGIKFFETAVQAFFLRRAVGTGFPTDGYFGYGIENRGQCLDVILTDGTCIHFILSDVNSVYHTNGSYIDDPYYSYFAPQNYDQYYNIIQGASGNSLELRAKPFGNKKFAKKFNLGRYSDSGPIENGGNDIAFYRMYNLNVVNTTPIATSQIAENSYYNIQTSAPIPTINDSPSNQQSDIQGLKGVSVEFDSWLKGTGLGKIGEYKRFKATKSDAGKIIWTDLTSLNGTATYSKKELKRIFGIDYEKVNDGFVGKFLVVQQPLPVELGGTGKRTLDFFLQSLAGPQASEHYNGYDTSGSDTEHISNEELERRLKYLFPNGIPTTQAAAESYITTVQVPIYTTINPAVKTSISIQIHRALADDIKAIFEEIASYKIPLAYGGSYNYRKMASGALSHHSYGVAIDLNCTNNPQYAPVIANRFFGGNTSIIYNAPSTDSRWPEWNSYWESTLNSVCYNSPNYLANSSKGKSVKDIFLEHGWYWGGNWEHPWDDLMHFSWTDH